MSYTQTNLVRFMVLLACGSVLVACGEGDGAPRNIERSYLYCDNPEVAAPSCDLNGYSMENDSELRAMLDGCTGSICHGAEPTAATIWTLDLSGSVEDALTSLRIPGSTAGYDVVDAADPDCSLMLSEVTTQPIAGVRMPVTGGFWTRAETDCFRSYLHEISN